LPEETRREFFAVQVEAGHQEEFFGSFLLEDHITVAIPRCCQGLGPIVVEELFQYFLPAKFTHDVFVEL